ncbi:MAG: FtsX-like permease family protein [Bacteroidota bacterium]
MNLAWLLKMAWRDSRRNRGRLLLFISSIVVGIAALVAINSFGGNLQRDINSESKTLLGADLVLQSNFPVKDSILNLFDTLETAQSQSTSMASMVYFPAQQATRLAFVRGLEGDYPFYGKFSTSPSEAYRSFRSRKAALVDKTLMLSYNLEVGDSIKVGEIVLVIEGQINAVPGRAGISSAVAPLVVIPDKYLQQTGLVQLGSRVEYSYYFKLPPNINADTLARQHEVVLEEVGVRAETVEGRRQGIGRALGGMTTFLNLVGFIALLLGCIGVASAVHIYVKDKLKTVAILRCLGVSGRQAFYIYLIQIAVIGLIGAVLGAVLGSVLQILLPYVLDDFVPVERISTDISLVAIGQGILTGLSVALLFALLPLLGIRRTSPLRTLRASFDNDQQQSDPIRWVVYALIALFVVGFTFFQTGVSWESLFFPIGILIALLLLSAVAQVLIFMVRKFFPTQWSYVWRQSIANLYRPNNQTLTLVVAIGLGTFLIATLFFTQHLLLRQIAFSGGDQQPNMILFDIQNSQKDGVVQLVKNSGMPVLSEVPIITMRLESANGITKRMHLQDTLSERNDWVYNREWRVTYRDTLTASETVIEGEWVGTYNTGDTLFVSVGEGIMEDLDVELGDRLDFNVQGRVLETYIGSVREIDFTQVGTNFFVLFPRGVLERAPQFQVVVTRTDSVAQSARFQQALVQSYSNVSVVDLTQVLKTVDDVLTKVSFVIRFMALFSILTGVLVLISAVVLSKYQRIKESVLLRTIGASRRQILLINALEYLLLGLLAALTGIVLASIASWALAVFSFKVPFALNLLPATILTLGITTLTVTIGLLNSRGILNRPPLEVLRSEIG